MSFFVQHSCLCYRWNRKPPHRSCIEAACLSCRFLAHHSCLCYRWNRKPPHRSCIEAACLSCRFLRNIHVFATDGTESHHIEEIEMCRVGQNPIYTVYTRYFGQGNRQIYGHIRFIIKVMAIPRNVPLTGVPVLLNLLVVHLQYACFPVRNFIYRTDH